MIDQKILILLVLAVGIYFLTQPSKKHHTEVEDDSENEATTTEETDVEKVSDEPSEEMKEEFRNYQNELRRRNQIRENFRNQERYAVNYDSAHDPEDHKIAANKAAANKNGGNKTGGSGNAAEVNTEHIDKKAHKHSLDDADPIYTDDAFGKLLPENLDPNRQPEVQTTSSFNKSDFLPGETNKKWFDKVVDLDDDALLKATPETFIGTDTQGQSLRNASRDLRGEMGLENPRYVVSPWNNTTITPDNSRRSMPIQ